jgi:hypothetical protein
MASLWSGSSRHSRFNAARPLVERSETMARGLILELEGLSPEALCRRVTTPGS